MSEADLLQHAARCRRLARALSDAVGRRALLDLSAACENIAARLRRDKERGLAVALLCGG